MTDAKRPEDRRRFPRVSAPILVRPVSVLTHAIRCRVSDVSVGGLRAYADEPYPPGTRIELELLLPDQEQAVVLAEVVWLEELPAGSDARFDVGLRFVDAAPDDLARIARAVAAGVRERDR
ncbi:MAG TPA: PilZ domain-containing protein [Anaeromyxobacter sp.]|nr:PilZ domain-containing protein [Anaeromyxobacter sp.]